MKLWSRKREFSEDLISSEIRKVKFSNVRSKINDKNHNMKGIPLVATHHPLLKSFSAIIDKSLSILQMDNHARNVFTRGPMFSLCSAWELNSCLVKTKLYPLKRMVGSHRCKSKLCQVVSNIVEADSFTCSNEQTKFQINHRLDCNERYSIYFISCNNRCLKQYVGQAADEFRHNKTDMTITQESLKEEKLYGKTLV